MAEKAALGPSPTFAERMLAHSLERQRAAEKVVAINSRAPDGGAAAAAAAAAEERRRFAPGSDFSSAIDLIHEASEAIRISEQRAADLEAQMKALLNDATQEMARLKGEIAAKDAQIVKALEQAQAAEARAREAEAWLERMNEAVTLALSPLQKRKPG